MGDTLLTTPSLEESFNVEEAFDTVSESVEDATASVNDISFSETAELYGLTLLQNDIIPRMDLYGESFLIGLGMVVGVISAKIFLRG